MKKLPTLFPKDPNNLRLVLPEKSIIELNPEDTKVYIKLDGRACAVINGNLYVRYDARLFKKKRGKIIKKYTKEEIEEKMQEQYPGAIPCQDPDEKSGHWPHWIPIDPTNNDHLYVIDGYQNSLFLYDIEKLPDGTYEHIGPKVNNNPYQIDKHYLIKHDDLALDDSNLFFHDVDELRKNPYEYIKKFLIFLPHEGLVIYKNNEPVAKIRRKDFNLDKEYPYSKYGTSFLTKIQNKITSISKG